jgi:preprotein translocase subunit YajC
VLTSGGILGKVTKIGEESDYVLLAINDNNQITIKKDYIAAVLPKGSIQSL